MNLKNVEKKEKGTAVLTVEIGAEEFDAAVESVYRKNKNVISLPGFRKGKAPRKLVEQMYGADIFYEDAVNDLYPGALEDAIAEAELDVVGYPNVEMQTVGKEGFTFTAVVGLRPVPTLGQYKEVEVPKAEVIITPEDIEDELKPYISRASHQETVERAAAEGDTVTIDFEGFRDGVPFEGGKGEDYPLEIGSGSFIPGFEEQIVGMSAGDEKDLNVTFPENYGAEDLAGVPVVFKVKVHEVKANIAPELDDEFAKDVSEFDTLDELKNDLEKKLRERREDAAQKDFENAVLSKLIETTEMEIPDTMVEYEADNIVEDYEQRMEGSGITLDQYLQMMGSSRSQFREEAMAAALRQIQGNVIFEAVAEAENIQPSEEEINDEYQKVADEYDMDLADVKRMIPEEEIVRQLKGTLASKIVYDSAIVVNPEKEDNVNAEDAEHGKTAEEDNVDIQLDTVQNLSEESEEETAEE